MAWDSNRPIPWQRLIRDWLVYVAIMAIVFVVIFRDDLGPGPFVGLLISGPLFLLVAGVLAKFGYQRKTFRDLRTEGEARRAAAAAPVTAAASGSRRKPPPTRRTSTGPSRAAGASRAGRGSSRPGKRR